MYKAKLNQKFAFTIIQVRNGENEKKKDDWCIQKANLLFNNKWLETQNFINTFYFICTSNEPPNVMVMEAALAQDRPQFWVTYTTEPLRRKVM